MGTKTSQSHVSSFIVHTQPKHSQSIKRSASDSITVIEKMRRTSTSTLQPISVTSNNNLNLYRNRPGIISGSTSTIGASIRPKSAPATTLFNSAIHQTEDLFSCYAYDIADGGGEKENSQEDGFTQQQFFKSPSKPALNKMNQFENRNSVNSASIPDTSKADIYSVSTESPLPARSSPFSNPIATKAALRLPVSPSDSEYLDNYIASKEGNRRKSAGTDNKNSIKKYFTIQQSSTVCKSFSLFFRCFFYYRHGVLTESIVIKVIRETTRKGTRES